MNAVDLMRDIQFEAEHESSTSIIVSSPSTTTLTPHQSAPVTKTAQKKPATQTTPTKKTLVHNKPHKTRALSTSSVGLPGSTSKSASGNLHSSSGVTSPSHKQSAPGSNIAGTTGTRPRGLTYSSGTKSQVLSPGGASSGNLSSSQKGSSESVQSSSSRERKITSPNRQGRTK